MGCFKEIYTEQMDRFNAGMQVSFPFVQQYLLRPFSEQMRVEIDPCDLEILLADEKDEFTLSLFRHPEDAMFRRASLELLS